MRKFPAPEATGLTIRLIMRLGSTRVAMFKGEAFHLGSGLSHGGMLSLDGTLRLGILTCSHYRAGFGAIGYYGSHEVRVFASSSSLEALRLIAVIKFSTAQRTILLDQEGI